MKDFSETHQEETAQVSPSGIEMSELEEFNPIELPAVLPQGIEPSNEESAHHDHNYGEVSEVKSGSTVDTIGVENAVEANVKPSSVDPSDCGCGGKKKSAEKGKKGDCGCGPKKQQIVYAIGTLGYDFATETKRDGFIQATGGNVHDPVFMLNYLRENPYALTDIIWTLNQELTPIYAIFPFGPYAEHTHNMLLDALEHQISNKAERVSIPGVVTTKASLMSGQQVPVIIPNPRGIAVWSTNALVEALGVEVGTEKHGRFTNFLERVYYELRNFGTTPTERAVNYSATNAFIPSSVFHQAIDQGMELADVSAEKSPIGRPGTMTYDVKLTFFDPSNRFEKARKVYRWSVDVSDVIPVSVGTVRSWSVY